MEIICKKRCVIGEGPVWNEKENLLYFVNAAEKELLKLDIDSGRLKTRKVKVGCNALCFDLRGRLIVSREDGVFILNEDDSVQTLYDTSKYSIINANDMKVGPDKRIYVGTISGRKLKTSDKLDGKLFSIDKSGEVKLLLDGLAVSNGMAWSSNGSKFYHTDSVTGIIKEYDFDKVSGSILYTGRKVFLPGVDGFTIDCEDNLAVTRWDDKKISFVNTLTMAVVEEVNVPDANPASCCFAGKDYGSLIIVTANYDTDLSININAGYTFILKRSVGGKPFNLFG